MDEPDGESQTRVEDDDASMLNIFQRYDGYDWMSDPERVLLPSSNDQSLIDLPYTPEYETEPGLSPDSNIQGGLFSTPMSTDQYSGMPATPSQHDLEFSNNLLGPGVPNPPMQWESQPYGLGFGPTTIGSAGPYAGLPGDNDISGLEATCDTILNKYQKNDENDLQNYIQNYGQGYPHGFAQEHTQEYTEITFPTNHPEEMNIPNNTFSTSGFNAVGPSNVFDDGEMDIDPTPLDRGNEAVADSTSVSFATTSDYDDPSSEVDNDGRRNPNHRWCCKRWFETKKGSFSKHLSTHNPHLPCEASPGYCFEKFPTNKERNKHYRAAHKEWANKNGISDTSCSCEACETMFTRRDNRKKHWNRFPECRAKIEQMKNEGS